MKSNQNSLDTWNIDVIIFLIEVEELDELAFMVLKSDDVGSGRLQGDQSLMFKNVVVFNLIVHFLHTEIADILFWIIFLLLHISFLQTVSLNLLVVLLTVEVVFEDILFSHLDLRDEVCSLFSNLSNTISL